MQDAELVTFLNGLRGVQPMIFLAFCFVRRAMTVDELQVFTSLSDDAIRPALKNLAAKDLLFMRRGERGRQTWLPRGDTFFGREIQNPLKAETEPLLSSSSNSKLVVASYLHQEQEEAAESAKSGNCLAALDAAGIREPKRSQIARLDHVTPELIAAHVAKVKREGLSLGTAIHRIEFNWDVDLLIVTQDKNPNGHDHECRCFRCRDARNGVAMETHCFRCWRLDADCICKEESEDE